MSSLFKNSMLGRRTVSIDWIVVAGLILILDQASKKLALGKLTGRPYSSANLRPQLRPVTNRNIGFGLVRGRRALVLVWSVGLFGTFILVEHATKFQTPVVLIGLGAAIGGATGNLLDMVWRGAVVDFIDLRIWPVFNIADVAIVIGAGLALWALW